MSTQDENDVQRYEEYIKQLVLENRSLRTMCAIAHAGRDLYTDDGELQDNREQPWIDWRRDDVEKIQVALHERAKRHLPNTALRQPGE